MDKISELKKVILENFSRLYGDGVYRQHEIFGLTKKDREMIQQTIKNYFLNKKEEYWQELNEYARRKKIANSQVMINLGKKLSDELQVKRRDIKQLREIFKTAENLREALHGKKYKQVLSYEEDLERQLIEDDRYKRHWEDLSNGWIERYED